MKTDNVIVPAVVKVVEVSPERQEVVLTLTPVEAQLLRVIVRGGRISDTATTAIKLYKKYKALSQFSDTEIQQLVNKLADDFHAVGEID